VHGNVAWGIINIIQGIRTSSFDGAFDMDMTVDVPYMLSMTWRQNQRMNME
jgi:hypothetical protein